MMKLMTAASMALLLGTALPAFAQGARQTVAVAQVDVAAIASGYRSSKIVGSTVYNDQKQSVGKVDDLIVSLDGKTPFAVLSVGGFLGVGAQLVAVPFAALHFADDRISLPNASKDELKQLPPFKYASK